MSTWSRAGLAWIGTALLVCAVALVTAPLVHDDAACHCGTPCQCRACQIPYGLLVSSEAPEQTLDSCAECLDAPVPEPGTPFASTRLPARSPPR